MHSSSFKCIQLDSIGFNPCSMASTRTQAFNRVHTHSKAFMHTQFHLGISRKVHSVPFRITRRSSCALKHIQSCSILFNAHLKVFTHTQSCSIVFSCILLGSIAFFICSKAFTWTQVCSVVVTLTQRHSFRSDN